MRQVIKLVSTVTALMLAASSANAARIYRQYQYYTVSGKTAEQIDRALTLTGPYLESTGNRHPGASQIRFQSDMQLRKSGKYCRVEKANVDIHAKIFLPRWKQRRTTRIPELALIWDVLSRDIRRHEESHIVIARAHASKIEYAVRSLPYRRQCESLKRDVDKIIERTLHRQDLVQIRFDRIESMTFDKRISRLLVQQLERTLPFCHCKRWTDCQAK